MFLCVLYLIILGVLLFSALLASFFNKKTMSILLYRSVQVSAFAICSFISVGITDVVKSNNYKKGYEKICNYYSRQDTYDVSKLDKTTSFMINEEIEVKKVELYVENGTKYQLDNNFSEITYDNMIVNTYCGQYKVYCNDYRTCSASKINNIKKPLDINFTVLNYHNYLMKDVITFTRFYSPIDVQVFNDMNDIKFEGGYVLTNKNLEYYDTFDFSDKSYVSKYIIKDKVYYCYGRDSYL